MEISHVNQSNGEHIVICIKVNKIRLLQRQQVIFSIQTKKSHVFPSQILSFPTSASAEILVLHTVFISVDWIPQTALFLDKQH